jgi:hypothetical protein
MDFSSTGSTVYLLAGYQPYLRDSSNALGKPVCWVMLLVAAFKRNIDYQRQSKKYFSVIKVKSVEVVVRLSFNVFVKLALNASRFCVYFTQNIMTSRETFHLRCVEFNGHF